MPDKSSRSPIALILAGTVLAALLALGWLSTRLWMQEQETQQPLLSTLATTQAQAGEAQATATAADTTYTTSQQQNNDLQATAEAIANQLTTLQTENDALQATAEAANTHAADQSRIAQANQLAVQSLTLAEENLPTAMLLSIEASRIADTAATRNSLLYFLQGNPALKSIWYGDYSPTDLAFSPDGRYLAAVHIHGQVVLYDTTTGRPIGEPLLGLNQNSAGETNTGVHVAFSQSGRLIAAVKGWGWEGNNMVVWDTTTRQVIAATDQYSPHFVAFWGEDRLVTAAEDGLTLWNLQGNQFTEIAHYEGTDIHLVVPHLDGRTVAFRNGEGFVTLWNTESGEIIDFAPIIGDAPIHSLSFSPDGTTVAIVPAVTSSRVILLDMTTGENLGELAVSQVGSVREVEFSADGQFLMTAAGPEQVLQLWNVAEQRPVGEPLQRWGYSRELADVTLSPDGKMIVSSYLDGALLFWEPTAGTRLRQWSLPTTDHLWPLGFLEGEHTLVTYKSREGILAFWDVLTGDKIMLDRHFMQPDVRQYIFDKDYKIAAAQVFTNGIGSTLLVDLQSNQIMAELPSSSAFALNPEGTILATSIEGTNVAFWNTTTGQMIDAPTMEHDGSIAQMAFTLDGHLLATAADNNVFIWDVVTSQLHSSILQAGPADGLMFSPDSSLLATYEIYGGPISIWDTTNGTLEHEIRSGEVSWIAFAQSGPFLATSTLQYINYGSRLHTVYLWDRQTYQQVGLPFEWDIQPVLSSDGQFMATWHNNDNTMIWDMSLQSWQEQLCHVVNRNFSESEWAYYFGNEPYRQTCPDLP